MLNPNRNSEETICVASLHLFLLSIVNPHGSSKVINDTVNATQTGSKFKDLETLREVTNIVKIITIVIRKTSHTS